MNTDTASSTGYFAALAAFLLWGLFPLYWKLLDQIPALEIMLHRVAWCFVSVFLLLLLGRGLRWLRPVRDNPRLLLNLGASGAFISLNWYLYIWAINSGHIVETSLGYYINPLVNVALGTLVLGERLQRPQKIAVALAAAGVAWLTWQHGRLPWIALTLACSFACYGLIRKQTNVEATSGLAIEGALLLPLVLLGLGWLHWQGGAQFMDSGSSAQLLLVLGGPVTALPLILFAYGARRIPYSAVGMLQYLAPTLQLLIGVLVFHEPFDQERLFGFALIWLALLIFTGDGIRRMARSAPARRP